MYICMYANACERATECLKCSLSEYETRVQISKMVDFSVTFQDISGLEWEGKRGTLLGIA